jgi:hypothetical protein
MSCRGQASSLKSQAVSGDHIVHFARDLPALAFQPSDPEPAAVVSGAAWVKPYALTAAAGMINQADGKRPVRRDGSPASPQNRPGERLQGGRLTPDRACLARHNGAVAEEI